MTTQYMGTKMYRFSQGEVQKSLHPGFSITKQVLYKPEYIKHIGLIYKKDCPYKDIDGFYIVADHVEHRLGLRFTHPPDAPSPFMRSMSFSWLTITNEEEFILGDGDILLGSELVKHPVINEGHLVYNFIISR